MTKSISCPRCSAPLSGDHLTPEGELICPSCGGRFRTRPKSAGDPGAGARKPAAPEPNREDRSSRPELRAEAEPGPKKKGGGKRKKGSRAAARGRMLVWAV